MISFLKIAVAAAAGGFGYNKAVSGGASPNGKGPNIGLAAVAGVAAFLIVKRVL